MIRPARPDDLRPIVQLAIGLFGEVFPLELEEDHAVNSLAMILFSNGYVRVAEADGQAQQKCSGGRLSEQECPDRVGVIGQ